MVRMNPARALLIAAAFAMLAGLRASAAGLEGFDRNNRPLPLVANWNCNAPNGYGPEWQIARMKEGHHLLFTFRFGRGPADENWRKAHEPIFTYLRGRNAPLCLRWGNWIDAVDDRSPFGPVEPWRKAGEQMLGAHAAKLALIRQWYPDPPYVLMLSNNEGKAPGLKQILKRPEYRKHLEGVTDASDQERTVGAAFLERTNAMFDGMRAAAGPWAPKLRFIGYAWGGEANINMYSRTVSPLAWDGVSARNYIDRNLTDYGTYSAPVTAMNLRLKKAWYAALRKTPHLEISLWWRKRRDIDPARFGALCIWNLWVARPHSLRQFTPSSGTRDEDWPWYREAVKAVDMVHADDALRAFWAQGEPVVNDAVEIGVHVIDGPPDTRTWAQGRLTGLVDDETAKALETMAHHYYALKTSVDPTDFMDPNEKTHGRVRFAKGAQFRVWAQAQVMGAAPHRHWLVFAYAPRGEEKAVRITVPGHGDITLDVPVAGVFAVIDEGADGVRTIRVPAPPE